MRSVAGFFFSSENLGPLLSLYVLQDSGVICCLFFNASASALLTSCNAAMQLQVWLAVLSCYKQEFMQYVAACRWP